MLKPPLLGVTDDHALLQEDDCRTVLRVDAVSLDGTPLEHRRDIYIVPLKVLLALLLVTDFVKEFLHPKLARRRLCTCVHWTSEPRSPFEPGGGFFWLF